MKNDVIIVTSNGEPSTLVATEMTSGVIAGYKAHINNTPIHMATLSDADTIRDIVARLSALEHIRPELRWKHEAICQ